MTLSQRRRGSDPRPAAAAGLGPKKPGDLRALRTHLWRLSSQLGEDASNPTYFFAEPRVGYRMAKGEGKDDTGAGR